MLSRRLAGKGAVLIEGPKWCGKTTTARQQSKSILNLGDTDVLRESCNNVNVYNQNVMACLEELTRSIMQVNRTHGGILKDIVQNSLSEE